MSSDEVQCKQKLSCLHLVPMFWIFFLKKSMFQEKKSLFSYWEAWASQLKSHLQGWKAAASRSAGWTDAAPLEDVGVQDSVVFSCSVKPCLTPNSSMKEKETKTEHEGTWLTLSWMCKTPHEAVAVFRATTTHMTTYSNCKWCETEGMNKKYPEGAPPPLIYFTF